MKLLNWNIEHMNSWWKAGDNRPAEMLSTFNGNNFSPPISDVKSLAIRCANIIKSVQPDIVTIQEGAGIPEMEDFFNNFVGNGNWKILRGAGGGQALITAANMDTVEEFEVGEELIENIDLNVTFPTDVDADLTIDEVNFARKPQVVTAKMHGKKFIIINNHLKSKFVNNGEQLYNEGGESRKIFFSGALVARRRISGEAYRIREFIDAILSKKPNDLIIVAGDLNDGPGSDFFEKNFLTYSVVDRVFGSIFNVKNQLTHVLLHSGSSDYTAQFYDFIEKKTNDLVLDHIGLSPEISNNWSWNGRVLVEEYQNQIVNDDSLHERDKLPSDHRPVFVEILPKEGIL